MLVLEQKIVLNNWIFYYDVPIRSRRSTSDSIPFWWWQTNFIVTTQKW